MKCQTPNCQRAVPAEGHRFCNDCFAAVLRTGRPPEIAPMPEWLRRMHEVGLPAKDLTRTAA